MIKFVISGIFKCISLFPPRSFETGVYQGFIQSEWKTMFDELIKIHGIKHCNIISVYNSWDVNAEQHRRLQAKKSKEINMTFASARYS